MLDSKIMKEYKVIVYNLCRCQKILVPGYNGNENPKEPYTRKYQKHIACSYGYNLVCVDGKCSKPFKTNFVEDAVYNFINSMIEESNYCSKVIKNILTKNLP